MPSDWLSLVVRSYPANCGSAVGRQLSCRAVPLSVARLSVIWRVKRRSAAPWPMAILTG